MISYRVDPQSLVSSNANILEMDNLLTSASTTLESLLTNIDQQQNSLSSPSIDRFRRELISEVQRAIALTKKIADDSHKFATVSDQAGKHLSSIEEHYSAVLMDDSATVSA